MHTRFHACQHVDAQDRLGRSIFWPFWIWPQPMRRQCFSTRRLSAIFSCSLVHTGDVSCSFARSCFTCSHAVALAQVRCHSQHYRQRMHAQGEAHRNDARPGAHGADVEHEHLVLHQLADLALLLAAL